MFSKVTFNRRRILLLVGVGLLIGAVSFVGTFLALAQIGRQHWTTSAFSTAQGNRQLEFKRDYVCRRGFGNAATTSLDVGPFKGTVLHAEIFISGFSLWYEGKDDHELHNLAVNAWIEGIGSPFRDPKDKYKYVLAAILIDLRDEDPFSSDDRYSGCVGYTVIALTQP